MEGFLKRSWAEIDLDALRWNVEQIRGRLRDGCQLMGVVKADAYGHGAKQIARALSQCGVNCFGVSNIEEGMQLRDSGFKQPILVFGTTPPELAAELSKNNIAQTVYSLEYAQELGYCAQQQGVVVNCHLKLDTGMTRLGFLCDDENFEQSLKEAVMACRFPSLTFTGVFTHFCSADDYLGDSQAYTRMQFERFLHMLGALEKQGITFSLRHCANSAAILSYPEMHMDMVRPGVILYGMDPSPQCHNMLHLKPVMQLRSVIASVKHIPGGTQVSYGRSYTAPCGMDIAVVPIGYADGYQRNLSNKARMLVNGCYAPVVGRVCMDQLMLDVTGIPHVKRGDAVTVFGAQGEKFLPVDELADLLGTINYEITCQLSKRIPRVYQKNGEIVEVVDYLA